MFPADLLHDVISNDIINIAADNQTNILWEAIDKHAPLIECRISGKLTPV